jgi:hypothetical protein
MADVGPLSYGLLTVGNSRFAPIGFLNDDDFDGLDLMPCTM